MHKYWTIRVESAEFQWHTFALQSKGDCFLSANTKLVGFDKAVQLSSEELARLFCDAVFPTLRRRHGEAVLALVTTCSTTDSRIDDLLVRARIEQGQFAPNKRPSNLPGHGPVCTICREKILRTTNG